MWAQDRGVQGFAEETPGKETKWKNINNIKNDLHEVGSGVWTGIT